MITLPVKEPGKKRLEKIKDLKKSQFKHYGIDKSQTAVFVIKIFIDVLHCIRY
jgi:hypothetical protein